MRPLVKVGLVGAGYIGAFALASAVVTAYVAVMAPSRSSRLALLVATAIEASVFAWVAFIWFHPFQSP